MPGFDLGPNYQPPLVDLNAIPNGRIEEYVETIASPNNPNRIF